MSNNWELAIVAGLVITVIVSLRLALEKVLVHEVRIRYAWRRDDRDIRFGPVGASYYGSIPQKVYHWRCTHGVLGLADGQMIFVPRDDRPGLSVPFERIRWIGTRKISVKPTPLRRAFESLGPSYSTEVSYNALIVHYEGEDEWTHQPRYGVAAFVLRFGGLGEIALVLGRETGLKSHSYPKKSREDFGPERATRLEQDIYGQWSPAPQTRRYPRMSVPDDLPANVLSQGDLYLAPDRLLFDYQDPIYLAQIQCLDVYHRGVLGRLNPFDDQLLRIEYATPDGEHRVIGYVLPKAEAFGQAIHDCSRVPWEVHTGRKKKAG